MKYNGNLDVAHHSDPQLRDLKSWFFDKLLSQVRMLLTVLKKWITYKINPSV